MTVGFQIFNSNGVTVQADDTYRNLSVREQGAVTTNTLTNAGGSSFITFYRAGLTMPLVAIGGGGLASCQCFYDATNLRHGFIVTSASGIGAQVPYYIFDVPFDSAPGFGLQVFNSSGQKTFDILQKYMRVIDMFTASTRSGVTKNYDASRVYACIHMINGYSISNEAGNTMLMGTTVSSGTVSTSGIVMDGSQAIKTIYEQQGTILPVDVTNY